MSAHLRVEERRDAIVVAFDRPEKRNALSASMSRELDELLTTYERTALPLVLTSTTPGMFVAGTDLDDLRTRSFEDSLARTNARLFRRIEDHPWPTIAAVDGPALGGGCELALACDIRVATSRAVWGLPEVRLGLVPSAGALHRLPALIGRSLAADLILTGRRIDNTEGHRIGLVQRIAADDALDTVLEEVISDLAQCDLHAVRLAKEAMRVDGDPRRLVDALAQAHRIDRPETVERIGRLLGD